MFVLLGLLGCEADCPPGSETCGLTLTPRPPDTPIIWTDGMEDPVGSGLVFIVDQLAIADSGRGFDLDGQCRGPGDCVDNALWQLGQLGNDQIRQGLLAGETLLIMEIAGLDVSITETDEEITLKLYGAKDADDPFFPANNFQIPQGETKCCEFLANDSSLLPGGQPYLRVPARLHRGRLSSRFPVSGGIPLTAGRRDPEADGPIPVERIHFQASLRVVTPPELGRRDGPYLVLSDVLLGFALPARGLSTIENPYCRTLNQLCPRQLPESSVLDLIAAFMQPDVDLDDELGLERVDLGATGRVRRCLDENGGVVPPLRAEEPWTCVLDPSMRDGYSVAIQANGLEASVVGITED